MLFALIAIPASAQLMVSDDFEDGTYSMWKVWNNQQNEMAESINAYEGAHAYQIKVGTFFSLRDVKANSRYRVTFFVRSLTEKGSAKIALSRYDVNQKKMINFRSEFVELTDQYKLVKFNFDTRKQATTHRVTLVPVEGSGRFIIDNFVVEQIPRYQ